MDELALPEASTLVERLPGDEMQPDQCVIALRGELDIERSGAVSAEIDRLVGPEAHDVVLDLSKLTFMDSSGIAVVLRLAARSRTVVLRQPSPIVQRVIEATGLSAVLPSEP